MLRIGSIGLAFMLTPRGRHRESGDRLLATMGPPLIETVQLQLQPVQLLSTTLLQVQPTTVLSLTHPLQASRSPHWRRSSSSLQGGPTQFRAS